MLAATNSRTKWAAMEKKSEREHVQHFLHTCIKWFWKFHVVVAQNNSKEMYKKVCCTCKVAFLLIRPIAVFTVLRRCLRRLRWCYTRQFAITTFSATKRCNIVSNGYNIVPALQRCVALKIRADKGWAVKRARPSKKVWCSGLGLCLEMSLVFDFLRCGLSRFVH